jgi:hypothetical protein
MVACILQIPDIKPSIFLSLGQIGVYSIKPLFIVAPHEAMSKHFAPKKDPKAMDFIQHHLEKSKAAR